MWAANKKVSIVFKGFLLTAVLTAGLFPPSTLGAQAICPLDTRKPQKIGSLDVFKRIPVLNEGRIKPMETYGQNLLLLLSGKKRYEKESGAEWFARFLFAPRTTYNDRIFLINNSEIPEALGIHPDKKRRYSFRDIEPAYGKLEQLAQASRKIDEKSQSVVEKEILRLYNNVFIYVQLSGAMLYAVPHPDFAIGSAEVIERLQLPKEENTFSFFDLIERSQLLHKATEGLETKKQSEWTEEDKILARLMNAIFFWAEHYADCPFGLIPSQDEQDEHWLSPMDVILSRFSDPAYHEAIKNARDMTLAYWNGAQLEFDLAGRAFMNSVSKVYSVKEQQAVSKIPLELLYNKLNLFFWAKVFYGAAIFLFLFSLMSERKWLYPAAVAVVVAGFIPHAAALFLRIAILSRPPVSNLYETFIFVGLISALLGLLLEFFNRNWLGIIVAAVSGFTFLLISGKFAVEGDTMQMLVAVLNSNFWLSTHVLAITIGYAGCSVAGVLGHVYILQAMARPNDKKRLEGTYKNMMGILGFGLTMTFLGTMLGGIWADQSWGRFWGWDPKENGALLIVLWSAIIFHARLAKFINPLGAAVGCVFGLVVVMWAWFGVNLLSVGLHSYGFTSGIAFALGAYVVAELVFVAVAGLVLGKKNIKF